MSLSLQIPQEFYKGLHDELKDVYASAIGEAKRDFGYVKEYLTVKEACELVGVSRNTLNTRFIEAGLPQYRIGNQIFISKSELNQFIKNHRI